MSKQKEKEWFSQYYNYIFVRIQYKIQRKMNYFSSQFLLY